MSSPLADTSSDFRELLLRLLDQTTAIPQPIVRGRININLAPEPVLRAVPGLEASAVDRILSARRSQGSGVGFPAAPSCLVTV